MKIQINDKSIPLRDANTLCKKIIGLMFKKKINYCLRIKCNGIHTFFMLSKIDVILADKNNNIIYIYKNLKPNRIILPKKNVYYTYEFPNNFIKDNISKIKIID